MKEELIVSALLNGLIVGMIIVFANYYKEARLQKTAVTSKYVIPAVSELFNKLIDIKIYFKAKRYENEGAEFMKPPKELTAAQNKSSLVHLTELEELIEKNKIFLSEPLLRSLKELISASSILCNVEVLDEDLQKKCKNNWEDGMKHIEKTIDVMKKSINLYI